MTLADRRWASPSATLRAIRSVDPPAANGTTMRITLSGQAALADPAAANNATPAAMRQQLRISPWFMAWFPLVDRTSLWADHACPALVRCNNKAMLGLPVQ
ncbi:hypothetical protein G6F64_014106 [Rhizopus arrhizus]|uniref:Uncharacterized protein n=1 Tax=Rhizopus oryzae TaxID=64495 RepID=A0A9P6WU05_RHIOR|nr:hypothetical protein G6F64_014106 [Rhizopus arrhizus]